MSDEPFRMPRPVHREAHSQPTSAEKAHEEPKTVREESKKVNRGRIGENNSKKPLMVGVVVAVLVLLAVAGWAVWSYVSNSAAAGIDGSKYQAVFFTNGQVYFGKLSNLNDKYFKLTQIYYLQAAPEAATDTKKLQKTSDDANLNNVTMVKLGEEIHGPQDEMVISRDQVLFYENLKDNGKVATAISQYKKK